MKKKIISMLLCMAMCVTMLAGCGESSDNAKSEPAEEKRSNRGRRRKHGIPDRWRYQVF